jgi:hypothetical protein
MLKYGVASRASVYVPILKKRVYVGRSAIYLKISGQALGSLIKANVIRR